MTNKPEVVWVGSTPITPITPKQRKKLHKLMKSAWRCSVRNTRKCAGRSWMFVIRDFQAEAIHSFDVCLTRSVT
jgi:hypothetical protein